MVNLNEICNPSSWEDMTFLTYFDELKMSKDRTRMHRKNWECTQTLYGLNSL